MSVIEITCVKKLHYFMRSLAFSHAAAHKTNKTKVAENSRQQGPKFII